MALTSGENGSSRVKKSTKKPAAKKPTNPGGWPTANGGKTPSNRTGFGTGSGGGGPIKVKPKPTLADQMKKLYTPTGTSVSGKRPVNPLTGKTLPQYAPVAGKPKAPAAPAIARGTSAPPRPVGAVTSSRPGSSAPKVNPNLPPGAPGGPKKSPQQMETEKKMRDAATLSAYMKNASSAVQAELMPALNELTRQIADLQGRGDKQTKEVTEFGQRRESDLGELFGRLGNFTGEVQNASKANYEQLKGQAGTTYDALQQALGATYGNAQAASTAEMERLGIAGTAPNANAGMARDQQFLTQLAGVDKAALQTGLGNSQNSFDQLMGMARNNAATEGAVQVGQARRDTAKTLEDIRFELESAVRGIEGQRGDIEATRGEKIRQTVEALMDRDYNRKVETDDRQFERDLATQRFGLERQQVQASLAPQSASYGDALDEAIKKVTLDNMIAEQAKEAALGTGPTYRIDPRTGRRIITNPNSGFTPRR